MSDPAPTVGAMSAATQLTFDDLGPGLNQVTFVVVDLETDGGSPEGAGITEIGAVKVRGGEVVGQFQTLVHLGRPLPPFIRALTGITDDMLRGAPPLSAALPGVPGVRPGRGAGGPQRALRRELPQGCLRPPGHALARPPGGGHRSAGAPRPDPRRGPQLQARHARPALPDRGDPQPPRPGRCAGDRGCPARADGAGRQPRGAHPDRAAGVQQPRPRCPAAQARPGRWPSRRARGSTSSRTPRGRRSTWARPARSAGGS